MNQTRKTMTLISRIIIASTLFALAVIFSTTALAQNSVSLSVSPTIFEMSANPSQEWESVIRVINSNSFPMTVYADVVNFQPLGEQGASRLLPLPEDADGSTFAEWIDVPSGEITIQPEQTIQLPVKITVPEGVSPGGHFAAVLIGTRPPEDRMEQSVIETAQVVTSLFFLRVSGDINEDGSIRSFRTVSSVLERPEATFELRFENTGNVHIQPQGQIQILNMWGEERGVIPVNQQTLFGNVLPDSVRKFSFTWEGDWSISDIGRYRAVATLAYGKESRQFATSETTFWVLPWKEGFTIIFVIVAFVWLVVRAIKAYVRKMISMAGIPTHPSDSPKRVVVEKSRVKPVKKRASVMAPLEAGMLDLRSQLQDSSGIGGSARTMVSFVQQYKMFFIVLFATIAFISVAIWFILSASSAERAYEVTIEGVDQDITISSEEVKYEELKSQEDEIVSPATESATSTSAVPPVHIVNRSGQPGLGAEVGVFLESKEYQIADIQTDLGVSESVTVIVYSPDFQNEALALSQILGGALLSAYADPDDAENPLTIFIGQDIQNALE